MKKLLMLGASHFQTPAIKYAKKAGYYVITADFKPDNPGHKFADEYHNISTIDKESILKLAEKLQIDGILSYASDPGAPTAAYVAEKLGLPGNPYESVLTLQQKDRFRAFLKKHDLNVPESQTFKDAKCAKEFAESLLQNGHIIIKPVDSSGSKGVQKLESLKEFDEVFENALSFSVTKRVVIEEFIEKKSYQMDGDGFVWNGHLVFDCFGTQHNDLECNPHVPVGISFPYVGSKEIQQQARNLIDKVMDHLNMKVGGLNIEFITDEDNNIYLLELGPRCGGNLIPEVIRYVTDVDLIAYSVEAALGKDCSELRQVTPKGFYSSYILHSQKDGIVDNIYINEEIEPHIVEKNILVKKGDPVKRFNGSNDTLGTFILTFQDRKTMLQSLDNMSHQIKVETY